MKERLGKWIHPRTGERRIYINSSFVMWGDRAFLTETSDGKCAAHLSMKVPSDTYRQLYGGNSKTDWAWGIAARFDICPISTAFDSVWESIE